MQTDPVQTSSHIFTSNLGAQATFHKDLSSQDLHFIKSWRNVHGQNSLHLFFNHKTLAFSAILQSPQGNQSIPSAKDGFDLVKAPFLTCKSFRDRLSSLQPSIMLDFLRRELRCPLIKETSDLPIIELNIGGLLGGGAKVSRQIERSDPKKPNFIKGSKEYNFVLAFLENRYALKTQETETGEETRTTGKTMFDKQFAEKLTERICAILPFDQVLRLDKYLPETIDSYEDEYVEEIVLEIVNKKIENGRPELTDYTLHFGSRKLCIQLLRSGYFAKERARGGVGLAVIEKVLTRLADDTRQFFSKNLDKSLKRQGESFEDLLLKLEMKDNVQALLKTVSKARAKRIIEDLKKSLELQSDDQQEFDEFYFAFVSKDMFERIREQWILTSPTTKLVKAEPIGQSDAQSDAQPGAADNDSPLTGRASEQAVDKDTVKINADKFRSRYLDKLRLIVLSEMNLLDHEPSTLVELHNLLKMQSMEADQNMKKQADSNSSRLNDIRELLKSTIKSYKEDESILEVKELNALIPLAFVQDEEIFQLFLKAFLEDFQNDILFDANKVRMLSFILISTLRDKSFSKYIKPDDLISILRMLKPKIEGLSITTENLNLQEALNSLNDVLYLMGFIGTKGVQETYFSMVKDLTKYMQTHGLEKAANAVTNTSKDPSLDMKRAYAIESLKRIGKTDFENWQERMDGIIAAGQIAVNIGKGIFLGDVSSISEALLQLGGLASKMYDELSKSWFEHVNRLRFLAEEPVQKIVKVLFTRNQAFSKHYSFYAAELWLSVINQSQRKLKEKQEAIEALWFMVNGYDLINSKIYEVLLKSKTYKRDGDIVFYTKRALLNIAQKSDMELNMFIRRMVESPLRITYLEANQSQPKISLRQNQIQAEEGGNRYFLKVLMEKKPKLYALARIQKHSEKTLDRPAILIEFRGIDREKDFDDGFMRKVSERIENVAVKNDLVGFISMIKNLDAQITTKEKIFGVFEKKVHLIGDNKAPAREERGLATKAILQKKKKEEKKEAAAAVAAAAGNEEEVDEADVDMDIDEKPKNDEESKKEEKEKLERELKQSRKELLEEVKSKIPTIIKFNEVDLFDTLEAFLVDPSKTVLLIQGDAGTGKTLLLRLLEQKLWSKYNVLTKSDVKNPNRLPLRIALSEVRSFDKAVEEFLLNYGCTPEEAYNIKKEPAVILFDGYDEINQNINLYNLNKLDTWRDLKVIFTSRKENLTSLKEDYITCFTPGKDKSRVLSHSILPIGEKQIKKYFSAQTNQNEHKIEKLEKELKEKNGDGNIIAPVTAAYKRIITYLNNFSSSERYRCLQEVLAVLDEKIPKIKAIQIEEARKDINSRKLELASICQTTYSELEKLINTNVTDKLKAEMEKDLPAVERLEAAFDTLNKVVGSFGSAKVLKLTQRLSVGATFDRIAQDISENLPLFEQDMDYMSRTFKYTAPQIEHFSVQLKELSEKITPNLFQEAAKKLHDELVKLKEVEKRIKPGTKGSITDYLQNDVSKLEKMTNSNRLKDTLEKLIKYSQDLQDTSKAASWLYPEDENNNNDLEEEDEQPFQVGPVKKKVQLPSLEERKNLVYKLQSLFKCIKESAKGFDVFSDDFLRHEKIRYEFGNMVYDSNKPREEQEKLLTEMSVAYDAFTRVVTDFQIWRKDTGDNVTRFFNETIGKLIKLVHFKSSQVILQELRGHAEKAQLTIKAQGYFNYKKKVKRFQALQDQIKALARPGQTEANQKIHELSEMLDEIIEHEREFESIKDDINQEVVLRIKAIDEEISNLKKFTDQQEFRNIINNFRDIVISPFMLKMLLQTLIEFPKSASNKADLYRLFSKIHFEREKDKLLQTEKIPPKFNIIDSFYHYSKDLAVNMFIRKVTSIQAKSNGYKVHGIGASRRDNYWSRFFDDTDVLTKLSRRGVQIIEDDGVVRFMHKSVMEYFAARQFYDEIVQYDIDNQEAFDHPCLNKGSIIDNETAVYQFLKDIIDSHTSRRKDEEDQQPEEESFEDDDKGKESEPKKLAQSKVQIQDNMAVIDKKILEMFASALLHRDYGSQLDYSFFYPNLFLTLLMRKDVIKNLVSLKDDSTSIANLTNIFRWIFSTSEESQNFIDLIDKAILVNSGTYKIFWPLLPFYYHYETRQKSQAKIGDQVIYIEKKNENVRLIHPSQIKSSLSVSKSFPGVPKEMNKNFSWQIEAKLFLHGSLESIAVFKNKEKYVAFYPNKKGTPNPYELIQTENPWDMRECKWILRMNQAKKTKFMLISLVDPSVVLYGIFKDIKDYKEVFTSMCALDVHGSSVCDDEVFNCVTCKMVNDYLVCGACIENCHKGHEVKKFRKSGGFCDCRAEGHCKVATGCSSRYSREFSNNVMFKCKQCPDGQRNTILCIACRNHHESIHQNFEKVEGNQECECSCASNRTKILPNRRRLYYSPDEDKVTEFESYGAHNDFDVCGDGGHDHEQEHENRNYEEEGEDYYEKGDSDDKESSENEEEGSVDNSY